jgi:hypothetical protein
VKGANVERLEECIMAFENPFWLYKFASVVGANLVRLQNKIIALGDPKYIYRFAKFAKDEGEEIVDLDALEDAIIASQNAHWMIKFARDVSDDIEKIQEEIMAFEDPYLMYEFAKEVGGDFERIKQEIRICGDPKLKIRFARLKNRRKKKAGEQDQ